VVSLATRFGNHAMESLIHEILKRGARRDRFEVQVFGGRRMIMGMSHVGRWNIDFEYAYVAAEGLQITAEDEDGPYPGRVYYNPQTGFARVRFLRSLANSTIADRKRDDRRRLEADAPAAGPIDLV
jgi:chemotaxis protein CheD